MPRSQAYAAAGIAVAVALLVSIVVLARPHVDHSSPWYQRGYQVGQGVGTIQTDPDHKRFASTESGCDAFFDLFIRLDDPTVGTPEQTDRATFVAACLKGAKDPAPLPSGIPTPTI